MHVKVYKDGKMHIPIELRTKLGIKDGTELIITEYEGGLKINTMNTLLSQLRNEFANVDLDRELHNFRNSEFSMEMD